MIALKKIKNKTIAFFTSEPASIREELKALKSAPNLAAAMENIKLSEHVEENSEVAQ